MAIVLVLSGLITAIYSATSTRSASAAASEDSTENAHKATGLLIEQAYADTQRARTTAMETRKAELKNIGAPIASALDELRARVAKGELTLPEAKLAGLAIIRSVRFNKSDFFFAFDSDGTSIANPNRQFEGKNLMKQQDPSGIFTVRELLKMADEKGSGYLEYSWVKLNETAPSPKVGYVYRYAPWNWIIGTGVYVDDIDKAAAARLEATKQALGDSFSRVALADSGLLFVLDKDGKVVVSPSNRDLSELGTTDWGRNLTTSLVASAPKSSKEIVLTNHDAALTGTSEPWVMDVSTFPELGWTLVSAVPQSEIQAPGNSQALRQGLISLSVLLLGLIIGLAASRRLVRPVATMTKAAAALEANSFEPEMLDEAASRKDEVGLLARAFQRMGAEVVSRERKLREQVRTLTVVVDRQKVAEESGAITESDFFKDLQAKKEALRARNAAPPDSDDTGRTVT